MLLGEKPGQEQKIYLHTCAQITTFPGALLLNFLLYSHMSPHFIVMICHHGLYKVMSLCYGLCLVDMLGLMLWLMLCHHI